MDDISFFPYTDNIYVFFEKLQWFCERINFQIKKSKCNFLSGTNLPAYKIDEIAKQTGVNLNFQTKNDSFNKQEASNKLADGKRYSTKLIPRRAKVFNFKTFMPAEVTHFLKHMKTDTENLQEYKVFTEDAL